MHTIRNIAISGVAGIVTVCTIQPVETSKQVTAVAAVSATPKRHIAMRYALSKKGGWYRYGGNGPSSYDCSGLVVAAYRRAGVTLPRTTYSMQSSRKLRRISRSNASWGDIVFLSAGHVELVSSAYRYTFGAHKSGTRIGYRHYYASGGYPRFFRVS
jgi:cell wall-associated NlpC family hydrolase